MISTILKTASAAFDLPTIARTIIDSHFPNESEERKQERANELEIVLGQLRINEAEAKHGSLFVSGWRPFIGWSCGIVLVMSACVSIWGALAGVTPDQVEALGHLQDMMMPILLGLLGIGGMRSVERLKGKARNNLSTTP